jgi:phosphoribosylamine-glycine ligase
MRFVFFTSDNLINPVAQKLLQEDNEVTVGQIRDLKFTLTEDELRNDVKKEDQENKKRRLSMGNGIIESKDAVDVIKALSALSKLNPEDYFVGADLNTCFAFTQKAYEQGFTGMLPLEEDRRLEVARDEAKKIVQENYPDLNITECQEFDKAEDGIQFLEESDKIWVLKSKGDTGETVCPKNNDVELANQTLIDILESNGKAYEENGFILEQKILDGIEMTPQAVFWNGELVFTDLDIETKTIGGGEKGYNIGCGTNLIIRTDLDDKINKIAFPEYVHKLAKERKGMFIIDCGIIFDKDNKPYFTEFCYQRFGWDCFPTELVMSESVTDYFKKVVKGENPLKYRFGASVRLFNLNQDKDRFVASDMGIDVTEDSAKSLFLYDVKKEDDKLVTAGFQKDIGVICGSGDFPIEAIEKCYSYMENIAFNDLYYRAKDDFLSAGYPQAILNRLEYAVTQGLIKDEGVLVDIRKDGGLNKIADNLKEYAKIIDKGKTFEAGLKETKKQSESEKEKYQENIDKIKKDHLEELNRVKIQLKEILKTQ